MVLALEVCFENEMAVFFPFTDSNSLQPLDRSGDVTHPLAEQNRIALHE